MRISVLAENTACRNDLTAEHGLSLYIETEGTRILFDAGQSGAFADNAEKMGIDLRCVDFAVLSHGHYDHGGGLMRFLEINKTAPVYIHPDAFLPHYNGSEKYIGLNPQLRKSSRILFTGESCSIGERISLHTCSGFPLVQPIESYGLNVLENDVLRPDDFRHEQYLKICEDGKTYLFSGCSHKGILNIESWFSPDVLIGGFHFKKIVPEGAGAEFLADAAVRLLDTSTQYYTGHCTGAGPYAFLHARMGDRLNALSTGLSISFSPDRNGISASIYK